MFLPKVTEVSLAPEVGVMVMTASNLERRQRQTCTRATPSEDLLRVTQVNLTSAAEVSDSLVTIPNPKQGEESVYVLPHPHPLVFKLTGNLWYFNI